MLFVPKRKLPRLPRENYLGHAVVFWTMTLEQRARGWLNWRFHVAFRKIMLHTAFRESLLCPVYCLMPDHLHLVWMGLRRTSDQLNSTKFLGTQLKTALGAGRTWQHQAYDHVLRENDRRRNAFQRVCFYILANPVRAQLVERIQDWQFTGAIVPGYPTAHPLQENFWELFWKLYIRCREAEEPAPGTNAPL